jgi:RHS repeat-associated protein
LTTPTQYADVWEPQEKYYYFGSRPLKVIDRLGSMTRHTTGNYLPYGEESVPGGQNRPKFATYWRDGETNLDQAWHRSYSSTYGRFTSPDPYLQNSKQGSSTSWNAYSYTNGDPVNHADQTGLFTDPCAYVGCLMAPPDADGRGGILWSGGGGVCVTHAWLPFPTVNCLIIPVIVMGQDKEPDCSVELRRET